MLGLPPQPHRLFTLLASSSADDRSFGLELLKKVNVELRHVTALEKLIGIAAASTDMQVRDAILKIVESKYSGAELPKTDGKAGSLRRLAAAQVLLHRVQIALAEGLLNATRKDTEEKLWRILEADDKLQSLVVERIYQGVESEKLKHLEARILEKFKNATIAPATLARISDRMRKTSDPEEQLQLARIVSGKVDTLAMLAVDAHDPHFPAKRRAQYEAYSKTILDNLLEVGVAAHTPEAENLAATTFDRTETAIESEKLQRPEERKARA